MSVIAVIGSIYVFYVMLIYAIAHANEEKLFDTIKNPWAKGLVFITELMARFIATTLIFMGSLLFIIPMIASICVQAIAVFPNVSSQTKKILPAASLLALLPEIMFFLILWFSI